MSLPENEYSVDDDTKSAVLDSKECPKCDEHIIYFDRSTSINGERARVKKTCPECDHVQERSLYELSEGTTWIRVKEVAYVGE